MVYRRFSAARKVVAIAAKTQRRQPPLPFNDLAVNIVDIRTVAFLTEERLPRVRRRVIGDIQYTAIDRGDQHVDLFWHFAVFNAGFHPDGERLIRAHFSRAFQRQIEAAVVIPQR
ncbi:Uncharacterised protein [Salmonella enterica subsp. enterica serovar Typhi]|nr:Uncharacterised protein [Salmonella enterica subsp. enterica serovar Typhi]CQX03627.1 Uncharacterised protein [Salmonella enterica subsp. enterica serovar Typhi]